MKNGKVTFRYKPRKKPWRTMTLDAMSFMQRFLQHVLPKGFQKVRYSGFLHPSANKRFAALKQQLDEQAVEAAAAPMNTDDIPARPPSPNQHTPDAPGPCPHCGGPLRYIGPLPRWLGRNMPSQQQRGPPYQHGGVP